MNGDEDMARLRKHYDSPIVPGVDPADGAVVCPACGCRHFRVIYTRRDAGDRVVRRRQCRYCGRRLSTVERLRSGDDE